MTTLYDLQKKYCTGEYEVKHHLTSEWKPLTRARWLFITANEAEVIENQGETPVLQFDNTTNQYKMHIIRRKVCG